MQYALCISENNINSLPQKYITDTKMLGYLQLFILSR